MSRQRRLGVVALTSVFAWQTTGRAEPTSSPSCRDFVVEASRASGLPLPWIDAVMQTESGGDARAVSSAGAIGCMQILPSTWRDLKRRGVAGPDPFDPRTNMIAGAIYLRAMYDRYGWPDALAAYHAGVGRFEDYLATARRLPAATLGYVAGISSQLHHMGSGTPIAPAAGRVRSWTDAAIFIASGTHLRRTGDGRVGENTSVPLAVDAAGSLIEPAEKSPSDTIFVVHRP